MLPWPSSEVLSPMTLTEAIEICGPHADMYKLAAIARCKFATTRNYKRTLYRAQIFSIQDVRLVHRLVSCVGLTQFLLLIEVLK